MKRKFITWLILITIIFLFSFSTLASPPKNLKLENDYIAIVVNPGPESLGRFAIEVTGGDPGRTGDDGKPLIYGRPRPWTSFSTVQIDGENYVFGGKTERRAGREGKYGVVVEGPKIEDGKIITVSRINDVEAVQTLSFVKSSTTGLYDSVQIKYVLTNKGTKSHKIGLRVMLDTMLGENDGAPFRVRDQAILTDTVFIKGSLPLFWQAFDSLSRPQVIAQGTIKGPDVIPPDKIYFSNWGSLADGLWEFDFRPGRDFTRAGEFELDSALALYWAPQNVLPGESRTIISNFGLGGITLVPGLLSVGVTSPAQVVLKHSRTTFPVVAYIQNTAEITARDVVAEIKLPEGFTLARGKTRKEFKNIAPQEISQVAWEIIPPEKEVPSKIVYQVEVTASNTDPNIVEREIDFIGPPHLEVEISAPEKLSIENFRINPNPFRVLTTITNTGESTAFEVKGKMILPPGLDFAPREKPEKLLGNVRAGEKIEVPWLIEVLGGNGKLPYALELKGLNIPDLSEVNFMVIPALPNKITFGKIKGQFKKDHFISVPVLVTGITRASLEEFKVSVSYDPDIIEFIRYSRGRLFVKGKEKLDFYQPEIYPGLISGLGGKLPDELSRTELVATLHFLVKKESETELNIQLEGDYPFSTEKLTLNSQN